MCRSDIKRRYDELIVLGWLGRAFLVAPIVFRTFLPDVFQLVTYENSGSFELGEGVFECTLKEYSVVKRGVPFRLRLKMDIHGTTVKGAELLGIGCDLISAPCSEASVSSETICNAINAADGKRLVVQAITKTIFGKVKPVGDAVQRKAELEAVGEEVSFQPRKELWAQEGTSEKWLQQVSGYYFADARLALVRFTTIAEHVRFLFYLDPTEPLNSLNPRVNVNPEAIYCDFT